MQSAPAPLPLAKGPLWLAPGAASIAVASGEVIIREGQTPGCIFVVQRGAVALRCGASLRRSAMLAILGPAEAFGLESIKEEGGFHPEARAVTPSSLLSIPL